VIEGEGRKGGEKKRRGEGKGEEGGERRGEKEEKGRGGGKGRGEGEFCRFFIYVLPLKIRSIIKKGELGSH
jgi:hypothetical protein